MYKLACVLVFAAVLAVALVAYNTFAALGRARREELDAKMRSDLLVGIRKPMDRFISEGRLFQVRLAFAIIPAIIIAGAFLLAGLHSPIAIIVVAGVVAFGGWQIPLAYYKRLVAKRQEAYEGKILDLTMGLANALKAGMALPQALEKVMSQMGGVMQEELSIVLREYRLGKDLVEALGRLHERMPCEDMRLLTSAVKLTTQSGGSLAEVLAEMVVMIRGRKEFQDKLKTLTAQGRFEAIAMASAPIFAFFILYFVNPDLMYPLVTTVTGWLAIGATLVLVVIGFIIIQKIVTIEV